VRFGRKCEPGFLPVYSVDSEEEARRLLVAACPTNLDGEFIAPELVERQTLDNLERFGERLDRIYQAMKEDRA
jgi:hypothetical protein